LAAALVSLRLERLPPAGVVEHGSVGLLKAAAADCFRPQCALAHEQSDLRRSTVRL